MERKGSFTSAPDLAHAVITIPATGEARAIQAVSNRRDSQTGVGNGTSRRESAGIVGMYYWIRHVRVLRLDGPNA
jgi:hypothetical protein